MMLWAPLCGYLGLDRGMASLYGLVTFAVWSKKFDGMPAPKPVFVDCVDSEEIAYVIGFRSIKNRFATTVSFGLVARISRKRSSS